MGRPGPSEPRYFEVTTLSWRIIMGKYVLGWLLGVPAIVLVVIYFFMH